MEKNEPNKVIQLRKNFPRHRLENKTSGPRVIAVTSGKGGVGKTNIVVNLGYEFSKQGRKTLLFDADLGLGNLDVLLGLAPRHNLPHVLSGEKIVKEIILEGPGGMKIIPASSGIQELSELSRNQKIRFLTELDNFVDDVDVLLIDTAAGITLNVTDFCAVAQEIIVVVTPEPTSLTDAYALIKVMSMKYQDKTCKLLVNEVGSLQEGREIFRQLQLVVDRFLDINFLYLGCILADEKVKKSVRRQQLVLELYPDSQASKCFRVLAREILSSKPAIPLGGKSNLDWHHLLSPTKIQSI